jgi:hypothetical protein
MVRGTQESRIAIPDVNYRELDALNYSGLKLFEENPIQFYKEYILKEERKKKTSSALIIGNLVDFYLLECKGDDEEFVQRFDEKFILFEGIKSTKQAFVLADTLYEIIERDSLDGFTAVAFKEALETCQRNPKKPLYKGRDIDFALKDFEDNAGEYFEKKMEAREKDVVDNFLLDIAKKITVQLLTDDWTKDLYEEKNGWEIYRKVPIEWKCKGIDCKSEIDFLRINNKEKIIKIYDNKCTFDNESFEESYLKYKYYLQNTCYTLAVIEWKIANGMEDYTVSGGLEFVVADTSMVNRRPLRYSTTIKHIGEGYNGFSYKGETYNGVDTIINDIKWAKESGIWNCGRKAYENNGILKLKSFNG